MPWAEAHQVDAWTLNFRLTFCRIRHRTNPVSVLHFRHSIHVFENENCDGCLVMVAELMELSTVGVGDMMRILSPTDREVSFYSLHSWSSATSFPGRCIGTTDCSRTWRCWNQGRYESWIIWRIREVFGCWPGLAMLCFKSPSITVLLKWPCARY